MGLKKSRLGNGDVSVSEDMKQSINHKDKQPVRKINKYHENEGKKYKIRQGIV